MAFKIGQEVAWVAAQGEWRKGYGGSYFDHWGHERRNGRVVSFGDGVVVIFREGDAAPSWIPESDVFDAQDFDSIEAKIKERNISVFGHPEGKWATERAKKQEAK